MIKVKSFVLITCKGTVKCLIMIFTLFYSPILLNAQSPGGLDLSFGEEGKVITTQPNAVLHAYTSLYQSDGKIIIAGYRGIQDISDSLQEGFLFVRYLSNGKLDSSFGKDGQTLVKFNYSSATVASVVQQTDGKIIGCGKGVIGYPVGNYNGLLTRLNIDGSIDSTFGENGRIIYDSYVGQDEFEKVLLRENGKILVCGDISFDAVLIVQFLSDGARDESFGIEGVVQDRSISYANVADAALQVDGKIVIVGGFNSQGKPSSMLVGRYENTGEIDNSFGNKGKTITKLSGLSESFNAVAMQEDGKIIAAGYSNGFSDNETLIRYDQNGIIDPSFGQDGIVYTNYKEGLSSAKDVAIQPDGKIVTAVYYHDDILGVSNFSTNRYNTTGTLDSSFGINGTTITAILSKDIVSALLLQKDGKIIISGDTYVGSNSSLALARYFGDGFQNNKYVKIKKWLHHHGITWEDKTDNINYYSVQSSSNGNVFKEVARVFSNGNRSVQTYTGTDNTTAIYRVAAVSNVGSIIYSNTLALTAENTLDVKLYPNPVKNSLQIEGLPANSKTKLTLIDLSGNPKISTTVNGSTYSLNVSQLIKGSYIIKMESGEHVISKNLIKE